VRLELCPGGCRGGVDGCIHTPNGSGD
jgi:hypothetical protein